MANLVRYKKEPEMYDIDMASYHWLAPAVLYKAVAPFLKNPRFVLDAGAGTGQLSKIFKEEHASATVFALDLIREMLAVCKRKVRAHHHIQGNADKLPFQSGSFDVVSASGLMLFMPDIRPALREMVRVARPNGLLVFDFYMEGTNEWVPQAHSAKDIFEAVGDSRLLHQDKGVLERSPELRTETWMVFQTPSNEA